MIEIFKDGQKMTKEEKHNWINKIVTNACIIHMHKVGCDVELIAKAVHRSVYYVQRRIDMWCKDNLKID